jgi:7-cyano-7-deazaguanine reductase
MPKRKNKGSRPELETFPNLFPGRKYEVQISCPEFTAVCPRTGQPDFATIRITYVPDKKIVELKSLKLYMFSYRSEGVFHEHVTNQILDDFVSACRPHRCEVVGDFNVRGGIKTVVRAEFVKNESIKGKSDK